ncbi:MAG TPA: quinone oxidoreductase [Hyphomicrobiales bacterium]|jgi:NADPH2:quinone reductase
MPNAIRVHEYGGPDALKWEAVDVPSPGPGQAKIRHHFVGLNFIDVYHRTGLYKQPQLPFVLGTEGAGEVLEVGPGVTEVKPGDRVAYASVIGAYAEERLISAERLVPLPDSIDYKTAAAMMLQGMTVQYLLRRTFEVKQGTVMLLHAAAGGIGLIASQWARHLGATIIGTVGSEDKAALAKANGCTHVINYKTENFVERVKEITGGKGCEVVYDGVGKDTFPGSLDCLKPRGLWVSFGNASGPVPPFEMSILAAKGSLFATRPTLNTYVATREELLATAQDLFDVVAKGHVKIPINQTYPLSKVADAHRDLEARKTVGSTVFEV